MINKSDNFSCQQYLRLKGVECIHDISSPIAIVCGSVILFIALCGLVVYMVFIFIALGRKKFKM